MKKHRTVSLRVEQLESRLVPSQGSPWPYLTSNWSGYSVDAAAHTVTDVQGSWIVPKVTVSGYSTAYAATWIGIDGDNSSTVEQIGTDSDQVNGKAVYYAWYEMYPAYPVYLDGKAGRPNLPISPGDTITADVSYDSKSSAFVLTLTVTHPNLTPYPTITSFTTTQKLPSAQRSSAEWIMEAPSSGWSVLPLANFGSQTFKNAKATINGSTETIGEFRKDNISTSPVVYQLDIATYNRRTRTYTLNDTTGALNSTGDSFTVYYGPTQPQTSASKSVTFGPMDRLDDLQVPMAVTPAGSGTSLAVIEISPATAGAAHRNHPVLMNELGVQAGFRALDTFFTQSEGALGRLTILGVGMADGERHTGAGLPWYGLPLFPETPAPLTVTSDYRNSRAGGPRSELNAEPYVTVWSRIEQPDVTPPSTLLFFEDVPMEQMIGALALVAALPGLQIPLAKVKPAQPRRLPDGSGRPG